MRHANQGRFWDDIDARIQPIPAVDLPGQRHIVANVIETSLAYSLNYWEFNQATNALAYQHDLNLLEALFGIIQNHPYNGWNPDHF